MELVILSGLSGAGKSTAARYFEDMDYFCIDNVPVTFLSSLLLSLEGRKNQSRHQRYCFVTDIRGILHHDATSLMEMSKILKGIDNLRLVFLEAKDEILLSRYKQTRRNHPLAREGGLIEAIEEEKKLLVPIRELATDIIDTSELSELELRDQLFSAFNEGVAGDVLRVYIQSFGFKYGLPLDTDIILDVRFIPNPFYIPELKQLTGLTQEVQEYIFDFSESNTYLDKELEILEFLLPYYHREGKVRLNISIGCTGGHHRSVAFAEAFKRRLEEDGHLVFLDHRDIQKEAVGES